MKKFPMVVAVLCVSLTLCATAMAQDAKPSGTVLITNANVFDGKSATLATGMSVLVEGNKIARIAKSIPAPAGATIIDAQGPDTQSGIHRRTCSLDAPSQLRRIGHTG